MALKKSELYSSLWQSCDELRGGMDASQYKDYVLVLLFIKYVSDKYPSSNPYHPITVPKGASFKDMVALKGKPDIGDQINKRIRSPLEKANKLVEQGNTLTNPKYTTANDQLKTFDYVVANPPFSDKRWSNGLHPDEGGAASENVKQLPTNYRRFDGFGIPPRKQGDYAYLLHIVRSLKQSGHGACILPHGVLFRGNAEAEIRRNLVRKGYIKGIIGLPTNLFYGTGIPACIVVVDKQDAHTRKGIFMIDASAGYMKDGPKNRLRDQDIHRIVDVFNNQRVVDGYSRMISFDEIEKNDYNLNLPRYIDSQQAEDLQDIEGHLKGGIPVRDVDALQRYWTVCPQLRKVLFKKNRAGYVDLALDKAAIKSTIYEHPEFVTFIESMNDCFAVWRKKNATKLKSLKVGCKPKEIIVELSEGLLAHYADKPLIDNYDVYQHLMDYWAETMQDDCYLIALDGWKAEPARIIEKDKKGREKDKGWACDLVPKPLVVARYFAKEQAAIDQLAAEMESITAMLNEMEEEHSGEDDVFGDMEKVTLGAVRERLEELSKEGGELTGDEADVLQGYLSLCAQEATAKRELKAAEDRLDELAYAQYAKLSESDVKALVVDAKWLATLEATIHGEMDRISQAITQRVKDLAERYEIPIRQLSCRVVELEQKVSGHLERMGFSWM